MRLLSLSMKLLILLTFLCTNSFADNVIHEIKKQIDLLRARGVDTIIVHQYSLFNGRYNIPYDEKELQCDNEPTVAHIFWVKNKQWYCLRLDNCAPFEQIKINTIKFNKIRVDRDKEFNAESPHFTRYRLIKISSTDESTASISDTQLRKERGATIKTFKTINKIIMTLEDQHRFKRIK